MTQNPQSQSGQSGQKTCEVCRQPFNSERELQEHQKNAHQQQKQGQNRPGSESGEQKREKIA
jgi:hypothetical protein